MIGPDSTPDNSDTVPPSRPVVEAGHDPGLSAGYVPVEVAAKVLGIKPDSVRKRIVRGGLSGVQHGGRWYVRLDTLSGTADMSGSPRPSSRGQTDHGQDRTGRTGTGPPGRTDNAPVRFAEANLEAVRDDFLLPLVDRLRSLEREYGAMQAERDRLRADLAAAVVRAEEAERNAHNALERAETARNATIPPREGDPSSNGPRRRPRWWPW